MKQHFKLGMKLKVNGTAFKAEFVEYCKGMEQESQSPKSLYIFLRSLDLLNIKNVAFMVT